MTFNVKRGLAATNCGGPKLVAVQSYSSTNLSPLIIFCNAPPRCVGLAMRFSADWPLLCKNQEGVNVY